MQAAMAHPAHRDMDVMGQIIDELFEAHKKTHQELQLRDFYSDADDVAEIMLRK